MSWLDGLSAGLTAATQGAGGWLEGQAKGRKEAEARALAAAQALRQKHEDELNELVQKSRLADVDEARGQRKWEKEQTLRTQATGAADKKAQGLLNYFQKVGVEANPEVVGQYATASGMPTVTGAAPGVESITQGIYNAAGQGGRGIAGELTKRAMGALAKSAKKGGEITDLGAGMGFAQDPGALARRLRSEQYTAQYGNAESQARKIAVRQAVQQATAQYAAGKKDAMGISYEQPPLDPMTARQKAMQDATEIYGAEAVREAIGGTDRKPVDNIASEAERAIAAINASALPAAEKQKRVAGVRAKQASLTAKP